MIRQKNGKKLATENFKNYKIITGTVDNKNPKSIYIVITSWGETILSEDVNYNNIIRHFAKEIKKTIYDNLSDTLFSKNKCIVDFDMRESGISYGKKSFMSCEITLYQKNLFKLQENNIQKELNNIINKIINEILETNKYFKFSKTK